MVQTQLNWRRLSETSFETPYRDHRTEQLMRELKLTSYGISNGNINSYSCMEFAGDRPLYPYCKYSQIVVEGKGT